MLVLRRVLFAVVTDEDWSRVSGLPVSVEHVLAVLTAVAVVAAMRIVGILLIAAMMVLPVASGQLLARSFRARCDGRWPSAWPRPWGARGRPDLGPRLRAARSSWSREVFGVIAAGHATAPRALQPEVRHLRCRSRSTSDPSPARLRDAGQRS